MHYGLDIGGTKIEIAAYDKDFNPLSRQRVATPTSGYRIFLETVRQLVTQFDQLYGVEGSVGIGLPGVEEKNSGLLQVANIPSVHGKNLRQDLGRLINRPVALENDARCFVYSEAMGGAADKYQRVFGMILGTGAGGGLLISDTSGRKSLYHGASHLAGEWGHIALPSGLQQRYRLPLFQCGCGLKGCYETYIAGPGLVRLYQHFGQTGTKVSPEDIVEQVRRGNLQATRTFACFIDIAGAAIANLMLVVDPDAFVMGGGLANISALYQQLPQAVEEHLFSGRTLPAILMPTFGDASGVRGAALLGAALPDGKTDAKKSA